MEKMELLELQRFAAEIRLETLKEVATRGFGHLAGSLSVVDLLAILYGKEMRYDPKNPDWDDRDILVMSKGHAGPAVYATLALKGFFPMDWLKTLNQPGTKLPSHCDRKLTPGIDMTTGSLGQGTSTAMGMALGRKLQGKDSRVYLVVGDGECNEGQVWEAALFAAQQKLDNLVMFVDYNGKQLDGYTDDILALGDLDKKFEEFGFFTQRIDGADIEALNKALEAAKNTKGKPSCIVLNTVKGKGIKALEDMLLNHHIQLSGEFIEEAELELGDNLKKIEEEIALCSK